jgi:hypothetical protein
LVANAYGSFNHEVIVEFLGAILDLQVPMFAIDRRDNSIMSTSFANRRVTYLRFDVVLIDMKYEMGTECCSESRIGSGYHEEVRNSPVNKIHIREVTFGGSRKVLVFDRMFLEGFGGPPVGP